MESGGDIKQGKTRKAVDSLYYKLYHTSLSWHLGNLNDTGKIC